MKKIFLLSSIGSLLILFAGCNAVDKIIDPPPEIHPFTIVYCDFTSSVDSTRSIEKIKRDAIDILAQQDPKDRIDFYAISKDNMSDRLYSTAAIKGELAPSERRAFDKSLPFRKDSLRQVLDIASSKYIKNRKEPNSCIIDCIERSMNDFRNYPDTLLVPLRLYILSDMLECCTGNGRLPLCIENTSSIGEQISQIPLVTDSTYSFKEFRDIKVFIILASSNSLSNNFQKLKDFWKPVFLRYQYDGMPYYSTSLQEKE